MGFEVGGILGFDLADHRDLGHHQNGTEQCRRRVQGIVDFAVACFLPLLGLILWLLLGPKG